MKLPCGLCRKDEGESVVPAFGGSLHVPVCAACATASPTPERLRNRVEKFVRARLLREPAFVYGEEFETRLAERFAEYRKGKGKRRGR